MRQLIKDGRVVSPDPFTLVGIDESLPPEGGVIVPLARWEAEREALERRDGLLGVRLGSDEPPDRIAAGLDRLAVVALEFPAFRDGRAYSYARLLRERYGFRGEIRAVGDVLLEQLHYMARVGFDAFELDSDDPERDFRVAAADLSVCYQPAADRRPTAVELRHRRA